ncbi:MAG: hypothetical protein ACTID3_08660 [Halomonas sp.]|uniref:hypothetical protein n=1 Tax=Halomonas sp. TaxID=1486246 RepID=UPI003F916D7C
MSPNYDAIGRCLKLKEEISSLTVKRNKAIMDLRHQLHSTMGSNSPANVVYTFDSEKAYAAIKALDDANTELMATVSEFNEYAVEGESQPYQVKEPRE